MGAKKRAALYVRISQTTETSTSIQRQKEDLESLAEREGWEVVATFEDDGVSGRKSRDNVESALHLLSKREVDVLAVWKIDRFGRRGARDLVAIEDALKENPDGRFLTYDGKVDSDNEHWDLIAGLNTSLAKKESESISARVRSSRAHLATPAFRYAGGGTPLRISLRTPPLGLRARPRTGSNRGRDRSGYRRAAGRRRVSRLYRARQTGNTVLSQM